MVVAARHACARRHVHTVCVLRILSIISSRAQFFSGGVAAGCWHPRRGAVRKKKEEAA